MEDAVQERFKRELTSLHNTIASGMILKLVSEMQHRVSSKPLDKVAGLVYLFQTDTIPIYDTE